MGWAARLGLLMFTFPGTKKKKRGFTKTRPHCCGTFSHDSQQSRSRCGREDVLQLLNEQVFKMAVTKGIAHHSQA